MRNVYEKQIERTSVVFLYSSALLSSEKMESQHYNWKKYFLWMHHANYQKRIRLTFVVDYFGEKWEEKVIFLCIIRCNKKKFFEWLFSPVIQLFPLHIVVLIEYKWHIKRAYWITGGNDVVSWIYCFGKGEWLNSSCHTTIWKRFLYKMLWRK